jgi:phosphocarrier protein
MIVRTVTINNRLGLHARAATRLVNCASAFESDIRLTRDDKTINGKSIMGVLMLAAAQGTRLQLQAQGPDDEQAIDAISKLIENRFGEDE